MKNNVSVNLTKCLKKSDHVQEFKPRYLVHKTPSGMTRAINLHPDKVDPIESEGLKFGFRKVGTTYHQDYVYTIKNGKNARDFWFRLRHWKKRGNVDAHFNDDAGNYAMESGSTFRVKDKEGKVHEFTYLDTEPNLGASKEKSGNSPYPDVLGKPVEILEKIRNMHRDLPRKTNSKYVLRRDELLGEIRRLYDEGISREQIHDALGKKLKPFVTAAENAMVGLPIGYTPPKVKK